MTKTPYILFTDLDGTLLNSKREVSPSDMDCLEELGRKEITRVIATGRSLFSYQNVITPGFPVDYLIFSTGAGILESKTGKLLHADNLNRDDIVYIYRYLVAQKTDFMVHHAVPENHHFTYFSSSEKNDDFNRRLQIYKNYCEQYTTVTALPELSAQIIAIFPDDLPRFQAVAKGLDDYQVTRTTSPLDGRSIWMEIYPSSVSKGESARWLCDYLGIDRRRTLGVGNDYNDISLLDFTAESYIVANAPMEMQDKFLLSVSNDENGFSRAVQLSGLLGK